MTETEDKEADAGAATNRPTWCEDEEPMSPEAIARLCATLRKQMRKLAKRGGRPRSESRPSWA